MQGAYLVNDHGKVMNVDANKDDENRNIVVANKNNGLGQQWDVVYADEYKAEPKKGEFNKDFGLYVDRPFSVISEMNAHRYLTVIDNKNMVIKISNGRKQQQFRFDQATLSIKSMALNKSWDIRSGSKFDLQSTNNQWY